MMDNSKLPLRTILKWFQITAVVIMTALLALTLVFLIIEQSWVDTEFRDSEAAFFYGPIGTELIPLPVLKVLPDIFPEHFQPGGPEAGDWVEQFGFLRSDDPRSRGLPVGFAVSNYRPQSAAPSPVEFVGFTCALCHTTEIRAEGSNETHFVVGTGSSTLNLFAWIDAFQAALLDEEKLTLDTITETLKTNYDETLPALDKLFVRMWLNQIRGLIKDGLPRFDDPFGGAFSLTPDAVPTGPGRTQPFRTTIRRFLDRPGTGMSVFTKIAPIYQQDLKPWAQVDGSVHNLNIRSSLAALAAGASVENLAVPEITHNVIAASEFTRYLKGPSYADIFPQEAKSIDRALVARGEQVYLENCNVCHGRPDTNTGKWISGERQGEVVPYKVIGTDPERVIFRHYEDIPDILFDLFDEDHPFYFERNVLRPGPEGEIRGYINGPIDSAFTRAPYLHNASVLTMAELINLKPRRDFFYRGRNAYDPQDLGFISPPSATKSIYFPFDTTVRGNSNKGHDYPWPYRGEGWNEADLRALLEYLKLH